MASIPPVLNRINYGLTIDNLQWLKIHIWHAICVELLLLDIYWGNVHFNF